MRDIFTLFLHAIVTIIRVIGEFLQSRGDGSGKVRDNAGATDTGELDCPS